MFHTLYPQRCHEPVLTAFPSFTTDPTDWTKQNPLNSLNFWTPWTFKPLARSKTRTKISRPILQRTALQAEVSHWAISEGVALGYYLVVPSRHRSACVELSSTHIIHIIRPIQGRNETSREKGFNLVIVFYPTDTGEPWSAPWLSAEPYFTSIWMMESHFSGSSWFHAPSTYTVRGCPVISYPCSSRYLNASVYDS